eukprot:scaffold143190_cov32-Tisochrysis_lutea.AAC.1
MVAWRATVPPCELRRPGWEWRKGGGRLVRYAMGADWPCSASRQVGRPPSAQNDAPRVAAEEGGLALYD